MTVTDVVIIDGEETTVPKTHVPRKGDSGYKKAYVSALALISRATLATADAEAAIAASAARSRQSLLPEGARLVDLSPDALHLFEPRRAILKAEG
jgi:hypothetical protein